MTDQETTEEETPALISESEELGRGVFSGSDASASGKYPLTRLQWPRRARWYAALAAVIQSMSLRQVFTFDRQLGLYRLSSNAA